MRYILMSGLFIFWCSVCGFAQKIYELPEFEVKGKDKSTISIEEKDIRAFEDLKEEKVDILGQKEDELLKFEDKLPFSYKEKEEKFNYISYSKGTFKTMKFRLVNTFIGKVNDNLKVKLDIKRDKSAGFRANAGESVSKVKFGLSFNPSARDRYSIESELTKGYNGMPGPLTNPYPLARSDIDDFYIKANFTKEYNKQSDIGASFSYKGNKREYKIPLYQKYFRQKQRYLYGDVFYSAILSRGKKDLITARYEFVFDQFKNENLPEGLDINVVSFVNHGINLSRSIQIGRKYMLDLSARYDINSLFSNIFSPYMTIKYKAGKTYMSFTLGRFFELPDFSILHFKKGYTNVENSQFYKPTRALKYNLKLGRQMNDNLKIESIIETGSYENYPFYEDTVTQSPRQFSLNYADVDLFKLELSLFNKFTDNFKGKLKAIYKRLELNGKNLPFEPEFALDAELKYLMAQKFEFTLKERYTGEIYSTTDSGKLNSYVLMDIGFKVIIGEKVKPFLLISNVFDKNYYLRPSYPGPGRAFTMGLNIDF